MKFISAIAAAAVIMTAVPINSAAAEADTRQLTADGVEYTFTVDNDGFSAVITHGELSENVTEINIPDTLDGCTVTGIANFAFQGSVHAESIIIPDSVKFIGTGAFMSCTSLNAVVVGEGITVIPADCFFSCPALESVTLPSGLETIGYEAFFCCPNADIDIPENVSNISENALGMQADPHSGTEIPVYGFLIKGKNGSAAQKYAVENGIDFIDMTDFEEGDVDGDGTVTTYDSSITLSEYARASTGAPLTFTKKQRIVADMNNNNIIEPADASQILSKYAYLSTLAPL